MNNVHDYYPIHTKAVHFSGQFRDWNSFVALSWNACDMVNRHIWSVCCYAIKLLLTDPVHWMILTCITSCKCAWFSLTMTGVLSFGLLTRPMWSLDLVCSGLQWHRVKPGSSRGWMRHRKSRGLGTEKTRLWRSRGPAGNEDLLTVMVQSLSSTVMLCTLTLPDEVRWHNSHYLLTALSADSRSVLYACPQLVSLF